MASPRDHTHASSCDLQATGRPTPGVSSVSIADNVTTLALIHQTHTCTHAPHDRPLIIFSSFCTSDGLVTNEQEGDKISVPPSVLSELLRRQAEIPWQLEIQLVRRKDRGKFEPVEVPTPPRQVSKDGSWMLEA